MYMNIGDTFQNARQVIVDLGISEVVVLTWSFGIRVFGVTVDMGVYFIDDLLNLSSLFLEGSITTLLSTTKKGEIIKWRRINGSRKNNLFVREKNVKLAVND